jgi:hypothetical protein
LNSLNPDREMLAQFASLMFKHARPDAFISLRLFPDKGSKREKPIDIEPIRIGDKDFLNIAVIRATGRQLANGRRVLSTGLHVHRSQECQDRQPLRRSMSFRGVRPEPSYRAHDT